MLERIKGALMDILERKGVPRVVLVDDGKAFAVQFVANDIPFAVHVIPTGLDNLPYAVVLTSPAVVDLPTSQEALLSILQLNMIIPMGAFGYMNGALIYKHSITDNDLTEAELDRILDLATHIVSVHAQQIISSFGGRLALDFPPGFDLKA